MFTSTNVQIPHVQLLKIERLEFRKKISIRVYPGLWVEEGLLNSFHVPGLKLTRSFPFRSRVASVPNRYEHREVNRNEPTTPQPPPSPLEPSYNGNDYGEDDVWRDEKPEEDYLNQIVQDLHDARVQEQTGQYLTTDSGRTVPEVDFRQPSSPGSPGRGVPLDLKAYVDPNVATGVAAETNSRLPPVGQEQEVNYVNEENIYNNDSQINAQVTGRRPPPPVPTSGVEQPLDHDYVNDNALDDADDDYVNREVFLSSYNQQ